MGKGGGKAVSTFYDPLNVMHTRSSGGGSSKAKVKAAMAQSPFAGVNNYSINADGFGSSNTSKQGDTFNTTSTLAQPFQQANTNAQQGILANQQYINQTPDAAYRDLDAGNNAEYNYQKAQNALNAQNAFGQLQQRFSGNGLNNSTLFGGYAAQQGLNNQLADLASRNQAVNDTQARALQNLGANSSLVGQLYGMNQGLGQLSNSNALAGMNALGQNNMFNASQQQNASQANAQLQMQQQQIQSALMGNVINAGGTIAGLAFGGPPGAAIGSTLAQALNRNNGAQTQGASSVSPTSAFSSPVLQAAYNYNTGY